MAAFQSTHKKCRVGMRHGCGSYTCNAERFGQRGMPVAHWSNEHAHAQLGSPASGVGVRTPQATLETGRWYGLDKDNTKQSEIITPHQAKQCFIMSQDAPEIREIFSETVLHVPSKIGASVLYVVQSGIQAHMTTEYRTSLGGKFSLFLFPFSP